MPVVPFDARRVLIALGVKAQTELELVVALDMRPSAVRESIGELMAADLVHIAAQVREREGAKSRLIETYAAGSKVRPGAGRRRRKTVERMGSPAR